MVSRIPDSSASQVRWLTREGSPNQLDLLLLAPGPIPRPEATGFRVGEPWVSGTLSTAQAKPQGCVVPG